jgi:hypothetical protein
MMHGPKPKTLPAKLAPLMNERRWMLWKGKKTKSGEFTKKPYQPNGNLAETDDPATWSTYEEVTAALQKFDGIGFSLSGDECPFGGFDLDDCIDDDGNIHPFAMRVVEECESYTEITPSGHGLRVLGYVKGKKLPKQNLPMRGDSGDFKPLDKPAKCEFYRQRTRYITITGNELPGHEYDLNNIDQQLDKFYAELAEYPADGEKPRRGRPKGTTNKNKLALPTELMAMLELPDPGAGGKVVGDKGRSELLASFLYKVTSKYDDDALVDMLLDPRFKGKAIFEHCHDQSSTPAEKYLRTQIEKQRAKQTIDGKRVLVITLGQLDKDLKIIEQAIRAKAQLAKSTVIING